MEIYISTDIETNGQSPGHFSMLSFGSVAFTLDKKIISTFERNLELLPNANEDPQTMEWWKTQPEAWKACRSNLVAPQKAMLDYVKWLKSFSATLIFVAHPVWFDYSFISWYLWEFTNSNPFSATTLDIITYAAATLKQPIIKGWKKHMPKEWFDTDFIHNHKALDDALGHAKLTCNIVKANLRNSYKN